MAISELEARATLLADRAFQLVKNGQREDGARVVREAASLAPDNPRVRKAFDEFQSAGSTQSVVDLCQRYAVQPSEATAHELLQTLRDPGTRLSSDAADQCTKILFDACTSNGSLGDEIFSSYLEKGSAARQVFTTQLEEATTDAMFEQAWDTGGGVTRGLVSILLDPSLWQREEARSRSEQDIFMLLIAKLMEAGQDHMDRALKELGRLLAVDAERLHSLVDADGLNAILSCLDVRGPADLRSRATFVLARYLAASKDEGEQMLSTFIRSRVTEATNDNLIVAFSAASAVFPIIPSTASHLFLTEGFAQSLVAMLNRKSKNTRIRQTALEMLSAACMDRPCRENIDKYCATWVEGQMESGQEPIAGIAAVVLAKLRDIKKATAAGPRDQVRNAAADIDQLVDKFKGLMKATNDNSREHAMEGLAFASLQPSVKDQLTCDEGFVKQMINVLCNASPTENSAIIFGALTVLMNLTQYPPVMSEEQKKMAQLRAYANLSRSKTDAEPAEGNEAVTRRCGILLGANIVFMLVSIHNKLSQPSQVLILSILSALSKEPRHRGVLAQQGAVKLLLQRCTTLSGVGKLDKNAHHGAAHALARILISVDPNLLFRSSGLPPTSSAVRPLVSLLTDGNIADGDDKGDHDIGGSGERDLLPVFEALLAITNLASTDDDSTRALIVQLAWPPIEDLLLSHNALIQRAAVEVICNLVVSPEGFAKFMVSDECLAGDDPHKSKSLGKEEAEVKRARARKRLYILLALADAEDDATRRAAAGALAMLTDGSDETDNPAASIVQELLTHERAIPIILALCQDASELDPEGIRHRGTVILRNAVFCGAPSSSDATPSKSPTTRPKNRPVIEQIKVHDGLDLLKGVLLKTKDQQVARGIVEVLQALV